jgi:hypothetical protein
MDDEWRDGGGRRTTHISSVDNRPYVGGFFAPLLRSDTSGKEKKNARSHGKSGFFLYTGKGTLFAT